VSGAPAQRCQKKKSHNACHSASFEPPDMHIRPSFDELVYHWQPGGGGSMVQRRAAFFCFNRRREGCRRMQGQWPVSRFLLYGLSPAFSSSSSPRRAANAIALANSSWHQIVPGTIQGTIPEASTPCKALPTRCCAKPPDLHTCLHPHPICNMYAKGGKAEWGREGPNRREGADQCGG
jgi:hypothetical protein